MRYLRREVQSGFVPVFLQQQKMSNEHPFYEPDDERQTQRLIRDLELLLQKRPPPSPLEFPNKSDIGSLSRHLDVLEDHLTLFSHNNSQDYKRLEKQAKLQSRTSDTGYNSQHAASSSSSRRNLTNSHSPNHSYSAPSRERDRVKQNSFTPNAYVPKTPVRRKSSKVPSVQGTLFVRFEFNLVKVGSDEEFDIRSQK